VQLISYSGGFAGEISNVNVTGLDSLDQGLHITYHYHRPQYLDLQERPPENTLPLASLHLQSWDVKDNRVRLYASSGDLDYKCRIELPAGITAQAPLPVKLAREYASYESDYSEKGQILTGERKITIMDPLVKGDHRHDYEAFTRAIEADEAQQMVLHVPMVFSPNPAQ
jgi:hypothetical protein